MRGPRSASLRLNLLVLVTCSAALLGTARVASAQEFRAALTGTVVDAQGGALPGAMVTAANTDTNVLAEGVTNSQGLYRLPQLPPGEYEIEVEVWSQGRTRSVRKSVSWKAGAGPIEVAFPPK